MSTALVLDLLEGCELVMNGQPWRVERLEPYWGKVVLRPAGDPGGQVRQTTIAALMHHRDCRVPTRSMPGVPAAGRGRQPATWKDLSEQQRQLLELRLAHIPAFLPKDWYDRHFKPLDGVNPMLTRRTAALRLVQMVAGGSLGEAAGFLGIAATGTTWPRRSRIYSGAGHVYSSARKQSDPLAFEAALQALAAELDEPAIPLIDFQRRRRALQTWSIDEDAWKALVSRLPPVPGPQRPELGDRKRQIASIYVWVQVTFGEHYFAPRPVEAAQPLEIQQSWQLRRNTIWHLMQSSRSRPHYTSLKTELNTLATSLARTIGAPRQ